MMGEQGDGKRPSLGANKNPVIPEGRTVRSSKTAAKSPDGRPGQSRRRSPAEKEPEDSAEELASFIEHISGVLFSIGIEPRGRFRFRSVNRAFLEVTGLKRDQIVGKLVQDVIPEPSCTLVLKNYREAIKTGKTVRWEETSVYPTGARHGEVAVTPAFDKKGKAIRLFGIVHDITARRNAEDALQHAESLLRGALDNAPFEFWVRNREGVCILQNQAVVEHWGDLQGKKPEETDVSPHDLEIWLNNNRRAIAGETVVGEVEYHDGGQSSWMQNTVAPYRIGGEIEGILGFNLDITARKLAEQALRESEARYGRAVRATKDGLWEWDIATGNTYLSPRWKELLGFADDELPNDRKIAFYDRLHPDDLAVVEAASRENLTRFVPYAVEVRLRAKNGEYRWFHIRGQAEGDDQGRPLRIAGAMSDITERKRTTDALRESEQRLRAIFEQAAVGVGSVDFTTGHFIDINQKYCAILGRSKEQLLATGFAGITHPEDLPASLESYEKLRTGKITEFNLEKRYIHPDGTVVWANVSGSLLRGINGNPEGVLAIVQDISARKKAEENYLRELRFNETLINNTSAIIVLLDHAGRMIYVNNATLKMLGYRRAELINRTPWDAGIMDAAETMRTQERLVRVLKGQENPPRETILKAKDGSLRHVELTSISTRTPNDIADRIIVTGTDLSERRQLQQEILRISEEEQAHIGHNLHDGVGQTMTGLASLAEMLEGELCGDQKLQAMRIRELVQAGIQEVRQISHSMSPMAVKNRGLGGALQLLADTIRINHRLNCNLEVDSAIQLNDMEKETHIYRIAQEAVNNAVRHGNPKNITLSLQRHGGDLCVLKIQDDGIGFKKSKSGEARGIGARVMDYRANFIGGTLELLSGRRGGVSVICRFPIKSSTRQEFSSPAKGKKYPG
jgi:PAS domain S-box-containing protein